MLKSLAQDEKNVQTGSSLLQVAEAGIQSQIDIIKNIKIKQKVLNASNDTNTIADRRVLQNEINQCYDEINSIATENNYNGKLLLDGTFTKKVVKSWEVLPKPCYVSQSAIPNLIPPKYSSLDHQKDPFD